MRIAEGHGDVGALGEADLVRVLDSPRGPVRQALSTLSANGVIRRVRSVGTFTSHEMAVIDQSSIARLIDRESGPIRFETSSVDRVDHPLAFATPLDGGVDGGVWRIERTTHVGSHRVGVGTIWTAIDVPSLRLGRGLREDRTWFEILREVTGEEEFDVTRRTMTIRAAPEDAERLDTPVGAPILFVSSETRSLAGDLCDRTLGMWCADRFVTTERVVVRP